MLIVNGKLITWDLPNQILEGQALFIQDDKISEVAPQAELVSRNPLVEQLDVHGQYIMPGNICAHTHFYGAFARGMAIPGNAPKDFLEILEKLWWPLDKSLREEDIRLSAMVMLADAIHHGTTLLVDHHASPNYIDGSLDILAQAVEETGIRAVLCYEVTDRDGMAKARAGISENVRFLKKTESYPNIRAMFGMHASLTLTDATIDACKQAAPGNAGFHLHVAESEADQYDSLQKCGLRVVERLHRHGILGPDSLVAHAVHVDAHEINLLAETGTWVAHQPRSNMNNAVGVAQVESMLDSGVPVCLGTDGFSSTMWTEWKTAYLVHKLWNKDPRRMPADTLANMGIYNNAALAGRLFKDAPLGVIKAGAYADLIAVDYHPYTPLTTENLPWHIVFGFHESMVAMTMVAGKVLMKDHHLLTLDEELIAARAREIVPSTWWRYQEEFSLR